MWHTQMTTLTWYNDLACFTITDQPLFIEPAPSGSATVLSACRRSRRTRGPCARRKLPESAIRCPFDQPPFRPKKFSERIFFSQVNGQNCIQKLQSIIKKKKYMYKHIHDHSGQDSWIKRTKKPYICMYVLT
jgi:hypothetical protein